MLALAGLFVRNNVIKKRLFALFVALSLFFSNEFIANELMGWYEAPLVRMDSITNRKYEWGIVLTGVTEADMPNRDRVYIQYSADRVNHSVMLYKLGIIRKILVSGGNGELLADDYREADQLRKVFLLAGVDSSDIYTERNSRNTYENAVESVRMLKGVNPDSCLLITSAYHMPRAQACFKKAGLSCDTFPTDSHFKTRSFLPDTLIIPSSRGIILWERIFKEIAGRITYALAGYT